MKRKMTTRVIHTPFPKKDAHESLNFPIYDSVAFEAESAEELEMAFRGEKIKHLYSRISNPTVEYFEAKIKTLTGAQAVTALASGMAAISNLLMAIGKAGDNIISSRHLFGNTLSLFEKTLKPYQLSVKYADLTYLPGVITLELFGHEIELLPRTLYVNRHAIPWTAGTNLTLHASDRPDAWPEPIPSGTSPPLRR